MSLKHELQGSILHVTETTHSALKTSVRHWYYDLANWKVSSHGLEGDAPDRDMSPSGIAWVRRHYFPKIDLTPDDYPAEGANG